MAALADHYEKIQDLNTDIWGISVDTSVELSTLRDQENLPFDLMSDQDKSIITEWDIVNEQERNGIAHANVYVIDQHHEIILHSRDGTASRANPEPLIEYLEKYDEDSSHRMEITSEDQSFMWPSISSLIWGLPRKFGCMKS